MEALFMFSNKYGNYTNTESGSKDEVEIGLVKIMLKYL